MAPKAEIKGKVSMDGKGVQVGLAKAGQGVKRFTDKIKGAGRSLVAAFAVGALIKFGRESIALASTLSDQAFQAGLTNEEFQVLAAATRDAGVEEAKLVNVFAKLKDAQGAVINGDKLLEKAFEDLGISIDDVAKLEPRELFEQMSKAITESGNSADKFASIADIIGTKNAPQMLEVMNRLSNEGFAGLTEAAKEAGQVMDDETIASLDEMEDSLGRVLRQMQIWIAQGINKAVKAVQKLATILGSLGAVGFAETFRQLKSGELFAALEKGDDDRNKKDEQKQLAKDARLAALKKRRDAEAAKETGRAAVPTVSRLRQLGAGGPNQGVASSFQKMTRLQEALLEVNQEMLRINMQLSGKLEPRGLK